MKLFFFLQTLFRSSFLHDKAPVIVLKDVDFENLKALVEYMYKGEANVPQHMLQSFIRTAESLQIRGLAEGATRQFDSSPTDNNLNPPSMPLFPPNMSTPPLPFVKQDRGGPGVDRKGGNNGNTSGGGILAARLKYPNAEGAFFDFNPEVMLPRQPTHQPPMKKPRKSDLHKEKKSKQSGGNHSPSKGHSSNNANLSHPLTPIFSNNNYDDGDAPLKIDEDSDNAGKENHHLSKQQPPGGSSSPLKEDDIVELENSNGMDSEEEEPSISGPSQVPDLSASMRRK